jgi:hypothetical protein
MNFRRACYVCGMTLLCSGFLYADFIATSQSAAYDPSDGLVNFSVIFNQSPNFFTTDSDGRQATDFQFYIIGDPALPYPADFDSIVRGTEIHFGGGIPIRDAFPPVPDPNAGGWGAIRGSVPFTLVGTELTFSVPLAVLSDHSTDGSFSYDFQTDVFGASSQYLADQQSIVLPEPATISLLSFLGICFSSVRVLKPSLLRNLVRIPILHRGTDVDTKCPQFGPMEV